MLGDAVDKACLEDSDCTLEGAEVREPRITATTSSCLGQETRGHEYAVRCRVTTAVDWSLHA